MTDSTDPSLASLILDGADRMDAGEITEDEWMDEMRGWFRERHRQKHVPVRLAQVIDLVRYWCSICGEPIVDDEPHTAPDGEDCHPACCPTCRAVGPVL